MVKVRRISEESKKCQNHKRTERERALAHNANERARYHNTKEQLMMLSMYVPGEDKESVHDTLSRIRLFNLGLEHFKSNLRGTVFNEFTVDEKLSFSSFLPKHKENNKGSIASKVKKQRPHVIRISSHIKDSDENNLIQTLQRLFIPCYHSEEEAMHPESTFVSQHKLSPNTENFEFSENSFPKSVFMKEKHNIYPVKNSFFKHQEENLFDDSRQILSDVKKSDLPVDNFTILKYKQCELYLNDYGNEVSCDDEDVTRLTVDASSKITNIEVQPNFLKQYFDSKCKVSDNLPCEKECKITDSGTTPSSPYKQLYSSVSESLTETKFNSHQPPGEKSEQSSGLDLDIDEIIHTSCQEKPWESGDENLIRIEDPCFSLERQKTSEYGYVFKTHDAGLKHGELSGEIYNSIDDSSEAYSSELNVIDKAIGMSAYLVSEKQKINDAINEQFPFYYPTSPEAFGKVSKEQFHCSRSPDLSNVEVLWNERAEKISGNTEPQNNEIDLEIEIPFYGNIHNDRSERVGMNDFKDIYHRKQNMETSLENKNQLMSEITMFKSAKGDEKAMNSPNSLHSHGRQVFTDVTNKQ